MICPRCGTKLGEQMDVYCPVCGKDVRSSSRQQELDLAEQKRVERRQQVFKTLRVRLVQAVVVLAVLLIVQAALRIVPHDEINAYFPPPAMEADITHAEKLPLTPERLPVPDRPPIQQRREISESEYAMIQRMVNESIENAPRYKLRDGSIIQGFIFRRAGDTAEILTKEGIRKYPENALEIQ